MLKLSQIQIKTKTILGARLQVLTRSTVVRLSRESSTKAAL